MLLVYSKWRGSPVRIYLRKSGQAHIFKMTKEIIINLKEELSDKFLQCWNSADRDNILRNIFSTTIQIIGVKPIFSSEEQMEYLKSIGVDVPPPENYRIYIGDDISSKVERYSGVELPASVLDSTEEFREEILYRIRRIVGSPEDN